MGGKITHVEHDILTHQKLRLTVRLHSKSPRLTRTLLVSFHEPLRPLLSGHVVSPRCPGHEA